MFRLLNLDPGLVRGPLPCALTIGNFDGVHRGHQAMLARLKAAALERGLPAAVMTFEPHPREVFTPELAPARLTSLREKIELFKQHGIERLALVRFSKRFAQLSPQEFIQQVLLTGIQARWILIGDDFKFGSKRAGDLALLRQAGTQFGFEVESLSSVLVDNERVSSTAVRVALAQGDMEQATRFLGRPYSISGRVVHGDKLGHELGYPTANVQMKHNKPPLAGIFAVELAGLDGSRLPGVASLGVRPTVKTNGAATLEVHVFDFHERIYGAHVRVDFLHKLRDEEKFPDLPTLIAQIERDVVEAKEYFNHRGTEAQR